jgi:hypothetical protein
MDVMNYQEYDVIQELFDAIAKENLAEAQECLAGNFSSVILRKSVKGEEFLEIYRRIREGMPDVKFKVVDITTDGESFKAKVKITGTHSKTIPSLMKGWRSMKPTRKKINGIVTSVEIILRGKQIMEIRNLDENRGVISGLLDQLKILPKSYSHN